jgi:hypothetical protein
LFHEKFIIGLFDLIFFLSAQLYLYDGKNGEKNVSFYRSRRRRPFLSHHKVCSRNDKAVKMKRKAKQREE